MFAALASDLEELSIPVDGRALTRALALLDQFAAKVAGVVGEFDRAGLWELDGATSMHSWLRDAGLARSEVTRLLSVGPRMKQLPVVAAAWEKGELSGGQVEAIVKNVPSHLAEQFAEHEAEIVPTLKGLSVSDTATAMRHWPPTPRR